MADRHSGVLIGVAGVAVVAGGVLISVAAAEVSNTSRSLSSNGWFDLGLSLVILGVALAGTGGFLHFRREVGGSPAPEVIDATPTAALSAAVNQAVWEAVCEQEGEFPDTKALTFRLQQVPVPGSAIRDYTALRCTVTEPGGSTLESTATNSWRHFTQTDFPGARRVRPGLYRSQWQGRLQAGNWVDLARGEHEVKAPPPLIVRIMPDSQFENWRYIALIAALHVQVKNTTDTPIPIGGYAFTSDPSAGLAWRTQATGEEIMSIRREIARRDETQHYGQLLRNFARIGAHETISGWFLVAVNRPPADGTPACTVIVEDGVRNEYRATLRAREPQVHG